MQTLLLTLTRSVADVDNNHTSIDDDDPYLATAHRQHHHQHQCPVPTITRKTLKTKTTSPALSIGKDGEPCGGLSLALAWTMTVSTPTLVLPMDASDGSASPDDVTMAIRPQPLPTQPIEVPETWLPCAKSSCSSSQSETSRKFPRCS